MVSLSIRSSCTVPAVPVPVFPVTVQVVPLPVTEVMLAPVAPPA